MRNAPLDFFKEKNKQQYQLINLAIVEASYVYMADVQTGSTLDIIKVDSTVKAILNDSGYTFTDSGDGYCWILSVESGANVGALRKITDYNSSNGTFTVSVPLEYSPSVEPDRIRISRNIFLANRNYPVSFYIPDDSYSEDVAMTYVPFPMAITPIGTNSRGEVMTLDISLSSVDRVISNAIQVAGGLQGNRVYHLRVFEGTLNQGKEYCIKDVAYIDSVSIDNTEIKLSLESKYNIVDVQLPQCSYSRDFCRFRFKSEECSWTLAGNGFYERKDEFGNVVYSFPLASENTCDHTLNGANGCQAHNNILRFGGFPTLSAG